MFDCERNSKDPIVRAFLDEHNLNLLKWPRENVALGELIIMRGSKTFRPMRLTDVFKAGAEFTPISTDDVVSPFDTKFSNDLSASSVVSFLSGLAERLGVGGSGKLQSAYATAEKASMRIRGAEKSCLDIGHLSRWLAKAKLDPNQTLMEESDRLFVIDALVRAKEIEIVVQDSSKGKIEVDISATGLAKAGGGLSARAGAGTSVIYKSSKALVVGVELYELVLKDNVWRLALVDDPVAVRGPADIPSGPAFLGGDKDNGEAFFDID